jgi:tRNA dimethylallyltransferase
VLGLPFDPETATERIAARLERQVAAGFVEEVRALAARPAGFSRTARQALGYRELLAHVEGGLPLETALAETVRRTRRFARRQWAWFRRDPRTTWLDGAVDRADAVAAAVRAAATGATDAPDGHEVGDWGGPR